MVGRWPGGQVNGCVSWRIGGWRVGCWVGRSVSGRVGEWVASGWCCPTYTSVSARARAAEVVVPTSCPFTLTQTVSPRSAKANWHPLHASPPLCLSSPSESSARNASSTREASEASEAHSPGTVSAAPPPSPGRFGSFWGPPFCSFWGPPFCPFCSVCPLCCRRSASSRGRRLSSSAAIRCRVFTARAIFSTRSFSTW